MARADIKVYDVDEVATILGIGKRTVYNYIKAKQIKAVKVGNYWRITETALNDFLERGTDESYTKFIREAYAPYRKPKD